MESSPTEAEVRARLARVRERLTSLVERRLHYGLTSDEEADYRRLTDLERELLDMLDNGGAAADAPQRGAGEAPGAGDTPGAGEAPGAGDASPDQGPGGTATPPS